jgi:hypothetical protein
MLRLGPRPRLDCESDLCLNEENEAAGELKHLLYWGSDTSKYFFLIDAQTTLFATFGRRLLRVSRESVK